MRSLIVEDEFTSRMQLKYFLEENGKVDIAVNGEEALVAIDLAYQQDKPYTLLCIDVKMPGMDGMQLLKKIRDTEENLGLSAATRAKVFMTTGCTDAKTVVNSFYAECDEYLSKPIDKSQLTLLLQKHKLI